MMKVGYMKDRNMRSPVLWGCCYIMDSRVQDEGYNRGARMGRGEQGGWK